MPYDPRIHHRRSIRLKGYDYTAAGAYYVTLNVLQREPIFGEVVNGEMVYSETGNIATACWLRLGDFFPLRLDAWVLMPDHLHGIIVIEDTGIGKGEASAGSRNGIRPVTADASPLQAPQRPTGTKSASLNAIIQNYKSISTRKINQYRGTPGSSVWQRDYFERVIRDEVEWQRIRRYILDNPLREDA